MNILGVSAFGHTSSACLVQDGQIVAAAAEERFTREKETGAFPINAITFCLQEGNIRFSDVERIAFFWDPWLMLCRRSGFLLRHMARSLRWRRISSGPGRATVADGWRMLTLRQEIAVRFGRQRPQPRLVYVEHHLAHAASAFYPSGLDEAAIWTVDGTGEWTTSMVAVGRGTTITVVDTVTFPDSLGVLYGAVTEFLGFIPLSDEWKVMGLAPYGRPRYTAQVRRLISLLPRGRFRLDQRYFDFAYAGRDRWYSAALCELFGPPREPTQDPTEPRFADLAASLQQVLEEAALHVARDLRHRTGLSTLCLAGGVALNCVMNGRLLREAGFKQIFVPPAAGDDGAALGAALYLAHAVEQCPTRDVLRHAYFGPAFTDQECAAALRRFGLEAQPCADIYRTAADRLAAGKIIGWFQGRMEFGSRALGNRSILADPRRPETKQLINARVKYREAFRPFAPSLLEERLGDYCEDGQPSPFMALAFPVKMVVRERIPAVVHVDGSARVQTVSSETNPAFYRLIEEFERVTGVPVVLNTSFNVRGEPIVCTPDDAIRCFLRAGLDGLVLGNYIVERQAAAAEPLMVTSAAMS